MSKTNYQDFLNQKVKTFLDSGFDIDESELNSNLFNFQRFIVKTALKKGKFAIFAGTGLGKSLMQLEWANQVVSHTQKPVLIITPLAISKQLIREGIKFGIKSKRINIDNQNYDDATIYITNYEQIENIDLSIFVGVVLDESSILKNFEGKIKSLIIDGFKNTPYKLACTATPSPNDPMELGNHSEFLDVLSRNQVLSMYFVHDGGQTSKWRLKGHAIQKFYKFVGSWSIMLSHPKDIGFDDSGYDLPPLNITQETIITDKRDNGKLFNDMSVNATSFNQELKKTLDKRMSKVMDLCDKIDSQIIIWVKQNAESEYLASMLNNSVELRGNLKIEVKEQIIEDFQNGKIKILITKTKIAQFGLNLQNCTNQIFASLDFSFEGLYQAIRRSYRFGQTKEVNIYLITTDTMLNVIESIHEKERKFNDMQKSMADMVNVSLDVHQVHLLNKMINIKMPNWLKEFNY